MKLGTLMDPNEARRGSRAYRFHPFVGLIPLDEPTEEAAEEEAVDDGAAVVNPDEPEPDDPDAA